MVGADPGGGVRLQALADEARRVAVDMLGALEPELLELRRQAVDDAGEVHHLRQPEHPVAAHQRLEIAGGEGRRGDSNGEAGTHDGRHEVDLELEPFGRVEEPVDAVGAEHVRDLVRVGDDRRRPERQHEAGELVDEQLHGLEVHVGVDEARHDEAPGRVDHLGAVVLADPGDHAVGDRDVGVEPLAREDAEDAPAADDGVGGLVSSATARRLRGRHGAERNASSRVLTRLLPDTHVAASRSAVTGVTRPSWSSVEQVRSPRSRRHRRHPGWIRARDVGISDGADRRGRARPRGRRARRRSTPTGLHVFPGVVDAHVHCNDPGRADWEGFDDGHAGARGRWHDDVRGHAAERKPADARRRLVRPQARGRRARTAHVDFALWGGLVPGRRRPARRARGPGRDRLQGLHVPLRDRGLSGRGRRDAARRGWRVRRALGLPVAVHAESAELTARLAAEAVARGPDRRCATTSTPGR